MADQPIGVTDQLGVAGMSEATSKFAVKLLEVAQVGIGGIFAPWQLRRMARAKADASKIEQLAAAKIEVEVLQLQAGARIAVERLQVQANHELEEYRKALEPNVVPRPAGDSDEVFVLWVDAEGTEIDRAPVSPLPERSGARLALQEAKRQTNIEQVVGYAFNEKPSDEAVSDAPVDPDWVARFFDNVKDVSDADMQKLWARLLAGEISHPGQCHLRTLDVLRNLSSGEAKLFERYCAYLTIQGELIVPAGDAFKTTELTKRDELSQLVECGLMHAPREFMKTGVQMEKPQGTIFWGEDYQDLHACGLGSHEAGAHATNEFA